MAANDFFTRSSIHTVDESHNMNDLIKLLHYIPFTIVQSFIKQQIESFNLHESRKWYYRTTSINEIFPSDIIQHILSFNKSKDINSIFEPVCKLFKQSSEKNEENYIKKLTNIKCNNNIELTHLRITNKMNQIHQKRIKMQNQITSLQTSFEKCEDKLQKTSDTVYKHRMQRSELNKQNKQTIITNDTSLPTHFDIDYFKIKYDKSLNNIWIIDKNRNNLNEREKKLFCKGPFNNFMNVVNKIKKGDKIYIYNDFNISNQCDINKDVQIIGMNDNKLINC
eukprot:496598_1